MRDGSSVTHHHIPIAYAYKLYSYIDGLTKNAVVYVGLDCVSVLIEELVKEYDSIKHYFHLNIPLEMSPEDELLYENATSCHICGLEFNENRVKCRDHDHMIG